jgi:hypothetical protein
MPCIAELPQLEAFKAQEDPLGFTLLLLDGKAMLGRTREIMEEKKITIPVLLDSGQYAREVLGTMYTPTTFVIDGSGRLRCRMVGYSSDLTDILGDVLSRI